jgi:hypothetical protein
MKHAIALLRYVALCSAPHLIRREPGFIRVTLCLLRADFLCAVYRSVGTPKLLCRKIRDDPVMNEWIR